ncbi:hypothetical protein [Rudanella lutea]|jgi:hypothetical protein|uniref:pPIWI_RE_Z domain-containing protein n=1 Tax=Rudanella lutea TaxID=451374 RepID=UPI00037937D5|nr:hypothetical protein [Rudanella lutea]
MNAHIASVSFTRGAHATARAVSLTARQLSEVELGLFLLSQLSPSAPPTALPALLNGSDLLGAERPVWTAKQHKYWQRGQLLLARFREPSVWNRLIERYALLTGTLAAYDVSGDRSCFREKSVGFFRNRTATFRQMLA